MRRSRRRPNDNAEIGAAATSTVREKLPSTARGGHETASATTVSTSRVGHVPAANPKITAGTAAEPRPVTAAVTAAEPLVDTPTPEPVAAPAIVPAAELVSESTLSAALAPLFGSGTGGGPAAAPMTWALLAAARNEFGSGGSSLTDGNLLRTSPDTGQDVGAAAALALNSGGQTGLVVDGSAVTGGSPSGVVVSGDRVFVTQSVCRDHDGVQAVGLLGGGDRGGGCFAECGGGELGGHARLRRGLDGGDGDRHQHDQLLTVINTTNYSVLTSIKVGSAPSALALTPDGTRLLVTNAGSNSVIKIDTATNRGTTLAIAVGRGSSSIAVSADSKYAYVTNAVDGSVTVITLAYSSTKTIKDVGISPSDVVVAGNKVYVPNLGGTVAVLSAASNTVIGRSTPAPGAGPGAQSRRGDVVRGHCQ
jgi:YVTN family beta-propeller protein